MKKILFNSPLQKKEYFDNVKKLLDSKKSLHGPGKNIFQIKKDLKKQFGFDTLWLQVAHLALDGPRCLEMAPRCFSGASQRSPGCSLSLAYLA